MASKLREELSAALRSGSAPGVAAAQEQLQELAPEREAVLVRGPRLKGWVKRPVSA